MTADLAGFLLAQLDADAAAARAATHSAATEYPGMGWNWASNDTGLAVMYGGTLDNGYRTEVVYEFADHLDCEECTRVSNADADHIALHDPAFELDRIAALRAVVELHRVHDGRWCYSCDEHAAYPCSTLLALAQPYRTRPGWHDGWGT